MAVIKQTCTCCGKELPDKDFYASNSILHKHTGKMTICKQCLLDIFGEYLKQSIGDEKKAIYLLCRLLDCPFSNQLYDGCKTQSENLGTNIAKVYIQKINSLSQYKNMKFMNSDFINPIDVVENCINIDEEDEKFVVTKDMIKFWGKGYSIEEYEMLQNFYTEWTTRYKCDTLSEEKTYKFLCLKELEIIRGREDRVNVDKLEETFRKFMSDANVTPRDANAANDPDNMNCLGLWIKDIEKYRPCEYFENKKIYEDEDGIRDYLERFVFRPLKNLLTGTRDFDKEFNVEEVDETEDEEMDDDYNLEIGDTDEQL